LQIPSCAGDFFLQLEKATTVGLSTTTAATAATATGAEAAATGESQPDVQCHGDVYAEHGPARTDL